MMEILGANKNLNMSMVIRTEHMLGGNNQKAVKRMVESDRCNLQC